MPGEGDRMFIQSDFVLFLMFMVHVLTDFVLFSQFSHSFAFFLPDSGGHLVFVQQLSDKF